MTTFAAEINEKSAEIARMAKEIKELTPRSENYSQWYQDLVTKADLAENSAVRGCMVIKPYLGKNASRARQTI